MKSREWGIDDVSINETDVILLMLTWNEQNGDVARSRSGAVRVE